MEDSMGSYKWKTLMLNAQNEYEDIQWFLIPILKMK